jgi:hypothetical protein
MARPPVRGKRRAQFGLHHLAVVVLRQAGDEPVLLRPLEARDVLEAEPVELGWRRDLAACDHEGHDRLAPLRIGAADDARLGHVRMQEQHLLHLARIDVGPAAHDQVLAAILEREEPIGV